MSDRIYADREAGNLITPHLGVTLRSLMGAAASANEGQTFIRQWRILYKDAVVGTIRLKNFTY